MVIYSDLSRHNEIGGPCPKCKGNGHDPHASIGFRVCQYCNGYGQFKIIWLRRPENTTASTNRKN